MECDVVELKKEIRTVRNDSYEGTKEINNYLDRIITVQGIRDNLYKDTNALYIKLDKIFRSEEGWNALSSDLKELIKAMTEFYIACRKSSLYKGVKSHLSKLRNLLDDVKELYDDTQIIVAELPKDKEFQGLISQINSVL